MNNQDFVKGMALGLMVGAAAGMVMPPKKKCSGMLRKALRTAGDVVDAISDTLGM